MRVLITSRLSREGNEVTIVDPSTERCAELEENLDAKVVEGSATRVRTMRRAGIREAQMLISVTDTDEVNLLCCPASSPRPRPRGPSRWRGCGPHEVEEWRRVAATADLKIDLLIHPERELAARVMRVIRLPGVSDVVDFADGRVKLFGMYVQVADLEPAAATSSRSRGSGSRGALLRLCARELGAVEGHAAVADEGQDCEAEEDGAGPVPSHPAG